MLQVGPTEMESPFFLDISLRYIRVATAEVDQNQHNAWWIKATQFNFKSTLKQEQSFVLLFTNLLILFLHNVAVTWGNCKNIISAILYFIVH